MPESYFEDADVTITADEAMKSKKFLRTKPYSGPVTLTYSKVAPAKTLATKKETATKGAFATPIKYKAPAVEETEEFYKLRVMCAYKKVNKLLLETTIWPKTTNVTINDKAGKGLPGCPFIVRQKGIADQTLNTDDQGKCAVTLMARKPYTIHMADAYTVIEDKQATEGQFRDHVLKVETAVTAKFVSPLVDEAPYEADSDAAPAVKQWINLKSANAEHAADGGCDAKGNVIVITVSSDPPEKGFKDEKIYFEVTFGGESKRNDPKPRITSGIAVLGKTVADKVTKGHVVLDSDGGVGSFEINLGVAGGDTCEVKIGGTAEVTDAKLKLINWRKVYAQITKMDSMTTPDLAPAIACLKKGFIDFEDSTTDVVNLTATTVPAGAMVDETVITGAGTGKLLVAGTHNKVWFEDRLKTRFASENLPCAHIIFCHYQLDGGKPPASGSVDLKGKKDGQVQDTVAYPGGGTVAGLVITGAGSTGNSDGYYFPIDLADGTDSVKSCKWKEVGGTNATGDITSADYKIGYDAGVGNKLFIRLPGAAKVLSDAGSTITVEYEVAWAEGNNLGWCTQPRRHNFIATVGRSAQQMCGTIVHEVGHAIGQSARADNKTQFPGLPEPPHARWYTNARGHSGNHCADGIDATYYNNLSNKMNTTAAQAVCTCIMYGSGSAKRNETLAFCAKCMPYVKAYKIAAVST